MRGARYLSDKKKVEAVATEAELMNVDLLEVEEKVRLQGFRALRPYIRVCSIWAKSKFYWFTTGSGPRYNKELSAGQNLLTRYGVEHADFIASGPFVSGCNL